LWITLDAGPSSASSGILPGAEKRYEFVVARELAASWGGTLTQEEGPTGPRFVLGLVL
jgi:hypothetical protein